MVGISIGAVIAIIVIVIIAVLIVIVICFVKKNTFTCIRKGNQLQGKNNIPY